MRKRNEAEAEVEAARAGARGPRAAELANGERRAFGLLVHQRSASVRRGGSGGARESDSGRAGGPNAARSLTPEHPARAQPRPRRTFRLDAGSDLSELASRRSPYARG
jgi:hypothetical protein